jgi:hypothetical protein
MTPTLGRVATPFLAAVVVTGISSALPGGATWLDASQPVSWNKPGLAVPAAPRIEASVDPRCRDLARPPELEEDRLLREQGWDLVGPYQGGWQTRVILATAGYDGMCRPRQYQGFVFVHGVLAGTLSPKLMDSRTDGALDRVRLEGPTRLIAEYRRYAPQDPLCCPSRTTSVVFDFGSGTAEVRPVSASTSPSK